MEACAGDLHSVRAGAPDSIASVVKRVLPIVVEGFWLFVLFSIAGLVIEEVFHIAVYHELEDRAGLLFGPFSPIYGIGGLCVVFLSRKAQRLPVPAAFLLFAVAGGAVEFVVSWVLQRCFGILAWDYTGTWLSIDGRTNGFFMIMWGLLGIACIYLFLPMFEKKIAPSLKRIPNIATKIAIAFMAVDIVITLVAFNCWYHRLDGEAPQTLVQTFCAHHFDDKFMAQRFETMSLFPQDAYARK